MSLICPTVTAIDPHSYREQLERVMPFADRLHLDFMDGVFVETRSLGLEQVWWPQNKQIDLHLMYKNPIDSIKEIVRLKPSMVIIHAEADLEIHDPWLELREMGIKLGMAWLAETPISQRSEWLNSLDYVLIFSGKLGYFGGKTDLKLLDKINEVKSINPLIEIGWDGGINEHNIKQLVGGGVDVLNVGGFIQRADNPKEAFAKLQEIIK